MLILVLDRQYKGAHITDLFVEFLCIYLNDFYEFDEIVDLVQNSTTEIY